MAQPCSIEIKQKKVRHCLKSGWHKDGKWRMQLLVIDTYMDKDNNITSIVLYSSNGQGAPILSKRQEIIPSPQCRLSKDYINVRNYLVFKKEDFGRPGHKLRNFDSMKLIPKHNPQGLLYYSVEFTGIVSASNTTKTEDTLPCPDYCCPGPKCKDSVR